MSAVRAATRGGELGGQRSETLHGRRFVHFVEVAEYVENSAAL